jgi:transcription-repair coupling factor (superfamily II helicase)
MENRIQWIAWSAGCRLWKTEVALRAAFKAVMDGKQVAMLVPTMILALQHWHTFSRRSPYPITVEMPAASALR